MGQIMTIEEFANKLKSELVARLGNQAKGRVDRICKVNIPSALAITITMPDCNIVPTIYVDPYYDDYMRGVPMPLLVDQAQKFYVQNRHSHKIIKMEYFGNFDNIKNHVFCRVIDAAHNTNLLRNVPWKPYLDLAIIYYYDLETDNNFPDHEQATITIKNSHLAMWDISPDQLHQTALKNTIANKPWRILSLDDVVRKLTNNAIEQDMGAKPDNSDVDKPSMYIISNDEMCLGATSIIIPDALADVSRIANDNVFILPSSIHEVIAIPASSCPGNPDSLQNMVSDINDKCVSTDEILNTSVYYYNRISRVLSKVV